MSLKNLMCFTLVAAGGLLGCSTNKQNFRGEVGAKTEAKLPIKFTNYQAFYTFVANRTYGGMPTDAESVFKLAADSTTEILTLEGKQLPYAYLITSHYYNGGIYDQIRGAQGNGDYYLLRPLATDYTTPDTDRGFELVGIAVGNTWRLSHSNGKPRFVTTWHTSAAESQENILEWNGSVFEPAK